MCMFSSKDNEISDFATAKEQTIDQHLEHYSINKYNTTGHRYTAISTS